MGFWDDPDLREGGDYFAFNNVGDTITGQIVNLTKHVFDDGKVAPQLLLALQDGTETTVSAGQIRLKLKLNALQPKRGDWIKITLTDTEKRAGGKTLKHFDVQVKQGNLPAQQQQAQPVPQQQPVQQAPVQYQQPPQAPQDQSFEPPF